MDNKIQREIYVNFDWLQLALFPAKKKINSSLFIHAGMQQIVEQVKDRTKSIFFLFLFLHLVIGECGKEKISALL